MSGVYLTLNQGVTAFTEELGRAEGRAQLRARAGELRRERAVGQLTAYGFSVDDGIDLRTAAGRGRDYEAGTIAHKLYPRDAIPLDEQLEVDLERALQAYDKYLLKVGALLPAGDARRPADLVGSTPRGAPQTAPKRRVFVSHSHEDNAFCREFVAALETSGMNVWYDEKGLSAGAAWLATIQNELESRELFVLIVSPAAWASAWVQEELQLAFIRRRQIIPVLHQATQVSGLLLTRQWVEATGLSPLEAAAQVSAQLTQMS